jgi:3-oxoadipate CoA-transferase beta subunit
VLDVTPQGLQVIERVAGLPFEELQRLSGVPLIDDTAGAAVRSANRGVN